MQEKTAREGLQEFDDGGENAEPTAIEATPETPFFSDEWPIKVKLLHKPIKNGKNEEVRELTFREPTGADINRIGNPVRIDQAGEIIIDDRRMLLVMGTLSGVVTPLLERMDPRDYNSCAYRLRNFFIPDLAAWLP